MQTDKKILFITEASLTPGAGADLTLYNLFKNYNADNICHLCPSSTFKDIPDKKRANKSLIIFKDKFYKPIGRKSIVFKVVNNLISLLSDILLKYYPISKSEINKFKPDIILICPISSIILIYSQRILAAYPKLPYIVYYMDYGLTYDKESVTKKSLNLLKNANKWIMISEQLKELFEEALKIRVKECFIAHNPIDKDKIFALPNSNSDSFEIAYAGSIWPMHIDAVKLVAKALKLLKDRNININFTLYTMPYFWDTYKQYWEENKVINGDWIPYEELRNFLPQKDILIVASSFEEKEKDLIKSSIQTKVTDYLSFGVPVLSIGPEYAACHHFIKKWNCGFIFQKNDAIELAKYLEYLMNNKGAAKKTAIDFLPVLMENFETKKVSEKLYAFINE